MKSPIKETPPASFMIDVCSDSIGNNLLVKELMETKQRSLLLEEKLSLRKQRCLASMTTSFDMNFTKKHPHRRCVTFDLTKSVTHYFHENTDSDSSFSNSGSKQQPRKNRTLTSTTWYTSNDFQRFRNECNETAHRALGDVDYQYFFLRVLYPAANALASSTSSSSSLPPVSLALPKHQQSILSTFLSILQFSNLHNVTYEQNATMYMNQMEQYFDTDLDMISKYRGLERIIFRNMLQPIKVSYIKRCVLDCNQQLQQFSNSFSMHHSNMRKYLGMEMDDDITDDDDESIDVLDEMDSHFDDNNCNTIFEKYHNADTYEAYQSNMTSVTSKILAQYYGHIDEIIAKQNSQISKENVMLSDLYQQPLNISIEKSVSLRSSFPQITKTSELNIESVGSCTKERNTSSNKTQVVQNKNYNDMCTPTIRNGGGATTSIKTTPTKTKSPLRCLMEL